MQVSCEKKLLPYKESQIHTPVSLTAWWTAHRQLVGIIMAAVCLNYGPHNVNCNGPPNTDLRNKHLSASVYRHPPPIVIAAGWLTPLQLLCSQAPGSCAIWWMHSLYTTIALATGCGAWYAERSRQSGSFEICHCQHFAILISFNFLRWRL